MNSFNINYFKLVYINIAPTLTYSIYYGHCFHGYIQLVKNNNSIIATTSKDFKRMLSDHDQKMLINGVLKHILLK